MLTLMTAVCIVCARVICHIWRDGSTDAWLESSLPVLKSGLVVDEVDGPLELYDHKIHTGSQLAGPLLWRQQVACPGNTGENRSWTSGTSQTHESTTWGECTTQTSLTLGSAVLCSDASARSLVCGSTIY